MSSFTLLKFQILLPFMLVVSCFGMDSPMVSNKPSIAKTAAKHILYGSGSAVTAVALDAQANRAITGYDDASVLLWDLLKQPPGSQSLSGHANPICKVLFGPDSLHILTQDTSNVIYLWDVNKSPAVQKYKFVTKNNWWQKNYGAIQFSADGKKLAYVCQKWIFVWDITAVPQKIAFFEHKQGFISTLAFSPNGIYIATGGAALIKMWKWSLQPTQPTYTFLATVTAELIFVKGGTELYSQSIQYALWNYAANSKKFYGNALSQLSTITNNGDSIIHADNKAIKNFYKAYLINTMVYPASGSLVNLSVHTAPIVALVLCSNNCHVITASADSTAQVWNIKNSPPTCDILTNHTGPLTSAAASLQGCFFITGSTDGKAIVWQF